MGLCSRHLLMDTLGYCPISVIGSIYSSVSHGPFMTVLQKAAQSMVWQNAVE